MVPPELKEVHCPFMRAMLRAGDAPKWDKQAQQMEVGDLAGFLQGRGAGDLHRVVRFLAIINHGVGNKLVRSMNLFQPASRISTRLMGSDGDHPGGSHIYHPVTGEFDSEAFRLFTASSTDGRTMTVADIGRAIAGANQRNGGSPYDALQSAAEFGLLAMLLGNKRGAIPLDAMRQLFEQNEFPAGARENVANRMAREWLNVTLRIADAIAAAATNDTAVELKRLKSGFKRSFAPLFL